MKSSNTKSDSSSNNNIRKKSKKKNSEKKKQQKHGNDWHKEVIPMKKINHERLFDTLFEYIRVNTEIRKELTERVLSSFQKDGYGLMVVEPYDQENKTYETDIPTLFQKLEWWNIERCQKEPLPEFLPNDPIHYSPEFIPRMRRHSPPNKEMIIAMIWRGEIAGYNYGTTVNTLRLWAPHIGRYDTINGHTPEGYNPYSDIQNVGATFDLTGRQCRECGRMKAKGYAPCTTCDKIDCDHKVRLDTLEERPLFQCSRCRSVYYCSKECQKANWKKEHKKSCVPCAPATNKKATAD